MVTSMNEQTKEKLLDGAKRFHGKVRERLKGVHGRVLDKVINAVIAGAVAFLTAMGFSSCGVTKASISKPAEGTQTTITITTNNPITTTASPDVDLSVPIGGSK